MILVLHFLIPAAAIGGLQTPGPDHPHTDVDIRPPGVLCCLHCSDQNRRPWVRLPVVAAFGFTAHAFHSVGAAHWSSVFLSASRRFQPRWHAVRFGSGLTSYSLPRWLARHPPHAAAMVARPTLRTVQASAFQLEEARPAPTPQMCTWTARERSGG